MDRSFCVVSYFCLFLLSYAFENTIIAEGAKKKTVENWLRHGCHSLEDLQKNNEVFNSLSSPQRIGIKHYYEFLKRIPRKEVERIERLVKQHALSIDKDIEVVACGSYRRGCSDSSDIDILISSTKEEAAMDTFLSQLVQCLHDIHFLTDDLSKGQYEYCGVCQLSESLEASITLPPSFSPSFEEVMGKYAEENLVDTSKATEDTMKASLEINSTENVSSFLAPIHRRIDIKVCKLAQWPFLLLYFTGSATFNRTVSMRAKRIGYTLNRFSIYKSDDPQKTPIPMESEEEIFEFLGLNYKHPFDRDV